MSRIKKFCDDLVSSLRERRFAKGYGWACYQHYHLGRSVDDLKADILNDCEVIYSIEADGALAALNKILAKPV